MNQLINNNSVVIEKKNYISIESTTIDCTLIEFII